MLTGRRLGIYFDGVLPGAKIDTRRTRLQNLVERLVLIRSKYSSRDQRRVPLSQQLGFDAKVPEPPFMVVAAIEALLNSRYANRMTVVPTEADIECVKAATDYDSAVSKPHVIITNDSDLLAAATGDKTHIMLLYELSRTRDNSLVNVQAQTFHPAAIARAVGLSNMMEAAFFMAQDRHLTLETAASTARRSDLQSSQEYASFREQYLSGEYTISSIPAPLINLTSTMDPRIAELAHQLMPAFPRAQSDEVNVFLPPLLEDVDVPSAWKVGNQLRGTVYSMLLSKTPGVDKVIEHARHGHHVGQREHWPSTLWLSELAGYAAWVQDALSQIEESSSCKAQLAVSQFRYLGTLMVVDFHALAGKPLSRQQTLALVTRATPADWTQLQLDAMLQVALYSLRMAKQLLDFEQARNGSRHETEALAQALRNMPGIADLLDRQGEDTDEFWNSLAEELKERSEVRVEGSEDEESDSDMEDAAIVEDEGEDEADRSELANNPFAMLSQ